MDPHLGGGDCWDQGVETGRFRYMEDGSESTSPGSLCFAVRTISTHGEVYNRGAGVVGANGFTLVGSTSEALWGANSLHPSCSTWRPEAREPL